MRQRGGWARLADPRGACRVRAKRGEERVHLDLPLGPVADGRVEHAGEREVEPAPIAEDALRPDLPVVGLDDSLADREPEAGASLLARGGVGDLVELPEDPLQI